MRKIGRYEIVEKIGEGGMGTVYKAVLPTLNRTVALKVLSDACAKDEEILQRFLREARVMAGLSDYTHVVQVFDLDEYQGGYFYTMEFIPNSLAHQLGEALHVEDKTRRVKAPKKKLAVPTAVKIAEHLLKGLKVIHGAGIVHRDISPHNVMLVKDDGGFRAKLADFGIAGTSGSHLTQTGMSGIGKQVYCAPEQWEGLANADPRSDLYSLGILMYRMVAGKLPMGLRIKQASELNPEVGDDLNEWILVATEQEPDDRFADAGAMLAELMKIGAEKTVPPGAKALPRKSAPAGNASKQTKYSFRSQPVDVSEGAFRTVFNLDDSWKPKRYVENEYEDMGNGVVVDHATGLMWEKSGSESYIHNKDAEAYIRDLNRRKFAGCDDWRLPTVDELASLLEPEERSGSLYIDPVFDTKQSWCWTSDRRCSGSAFIVRFDYGYIHWFVVDDRFYVRAVRSRMENEKNRNGQTRLPCY